MNAAPARTYARVRRPGLSARFLLAGIGFYQRYLSPRKGYRCAYGALHGETGCSGFVREAILAHGARAAIPLARARFRRCHQAARKLRAGRIAANSAAGSPAEPPDSAPERRPHRGASSSCDAVPDLGCCLGELLFNLMPGEALCGALDCSCCASAACL